MYTNTQKASSVEQSSMAVHLATIEMMNYVYNYYDRFGIDVETVIAQHRLQGLSRDESFFRIFVGLRGGKAW